MKIETKKRKKKETFSPGWSPLVPGAKPGLKEGTFSPDFVLPVPKPGLKAVENREYNPFLH